MKIKELEAALATQWDKVEQEDASGYKKVYFVNKRNPSEIKTLDQILAGGGAAAAQPQLTPEALQRAGAERVQPQAAPAPAAPPGFVPGMPKAYNEARMKQLAEIDSKALLDLEKETQSAGQAVKYIDDALKFNDVAYSGPGSSARGYITSQVGNKRGIATEEMNNLVTNLALVNLKAVFGGNPTEGERKILLEVQGSSSKAPEVREGIFKRAREAAKDRIKLNEEIARRIRSGTYLMPQPAAVRTYDPATGRWE